MSSREKQSLLKKFVFSNTDIEDSDWPVDHVPKAEWRSLWSISAVLLGFVFFAGTLYAGAEVGAAMGFGNMIGAMGVSYAILGLYVAVLCAIAAKAGLTTVLLSRYTFGTWGAKWADLLLGGTQVGWFGATIPMVAVPMAKFFTINTPTGVSALILLWGILHLATAYVWGTTAWNYCRKWLSPRSSSLGVCRSGSPCSMSAASPACTVADQPS